MKDTDGQSAEECLAKRINEGHDPLVVFEAINPDQDLTSWACGPDHLLKCAFWMFQMVNDADRENDIEFISEGNVVGTGFQNG